MKEKDDFDRLGIAIDNLKMEIAKALKLPQIVEWLAKKLK